VKVGDLVRSAPDAHGNINRTGIVVEMIQKKCWRTMEKGKKVDWNAIDPEPHAVVLFSENNGTISIPVIDLEVFDENR
jgi:hypothetical protein